MNPFGSAKSGSSVSEASAIKCVDLPETLHAHITGCTVDTIVQVTKSGDGVLSGWIDTSICGQPPANDGSTNVYVEVRCEGESAKVYAYVELNSFKASTYITEKKFVDRLPVDLTLHTVEPYYKTPCDDGDLDCELTVSITE